MASNHHTRFWMRLFVAAIALSCESRAPRAPSIGARLPTSERNISSILPKPVTVVCNRDNSERDDAAFVNAYGYGASEFASRMMGDYSSRLQWSSLATDLSQEFAGQEQMTVSLQYQNEATIFPDCDNLVELRVTVSLVSTSGVLDLSAAGVLSSRGDDAFTVSADVTLKSLAAVTDQLQGKTWSRPVRYRLELQKAGSELGGELSVHGPGGSNCDIATWPDSRTCSLRERPMDWGNDYLGMNRAVIEASLASEGEARDIRWEESGELTRLQVEFSPSGETACVLGSAEVPNAATKQIIYGVPGNLHIRTDDQSVDIVVPGRASVSWSNGAWGSLELSTGGLAPPGSVAALRSIDLEELPDTRRMVVALNPAVERASRVTGRVRMLGGLEVFTLDLRAPGLSPAGSGCLAQDFLGALTGVAHASYL